MDILVTVLIIAAIFGLLAVYLILVEVNRWMLNRGAQADSNPFVKKNVKEYIRVFVTRDNPFVIALLLFLVAFVIFMRHGQFLLDSF